jgi:hypothetical protein
MEALERFKKKLEDLAWNEMLYYKPINFPMVEYKIVYSGNDLYVVRKYAWGVLIHFWGININNLLKWKPVGEFLTDKMQLEDFYTDIVHFKPQIVPIT